MTTRFTKVFSHRFGPAVLLTLILVSISLLTRIVLLIKSASSVDFSFINVIGIFILGLFFDLVNAGYFLIPFILYLWLMPDKIFRKKWHRFILFGLFTIFTFILLFNATSEFFFWDEFNARFNFIAVDYLIYTTEVIGNIRQSYPIELIISLLVLITVGLVWLLRNIIALSSEHTFRFKQRSLWAGALLLLPVIFFFTINNKLHQFSKNTFVNELSGNGMYELFAAYLNNELDYEQFYKNIDDKEAFSTIKTLLKTSDASPAENSSSNVERVITNPGPEKKLNVVLISVESLSAEFLEAFGNTRHITPFMDSLAQHSLFFTNLYSTGTRTVRGLEALSICIPPTPGQSIVRRPHNENLFSLGKVFNEKGYESKYIYGGYGYFDNMNYFFANNGYEVADRSRLSDSEIDYENIWGVADENLFTLATREIENTLAKGKPAFAHIMTTSNHRPYTYPEGRIDIPSHTNRDGAVKYTDYAIGKFIKESSHKPWFNNTVFIIVADHCAKSAGKTELPVNMYHIPMLIYSPGNIAPAKVDRLMSQIDMGPTLLGLLNFSYKSKFFGYDIFKLEAGRERIFISTYQNVGYIKNNKLVILYPQKKALTFIPNFADGTTTLIENDEQLINEAISWYQVASYEFKNGLYK
ncbi:MAG TPA: sulfatase-like hydrolase/transferase [Cyclobacteriaceae bacterium]|nr:sulfatase-like hydrolase/transferase [Cyclobacteriaceae bacterium]